MGIAAVIYRFVVELSDIDRNVYETLELRVALHPSEEPERLIVRVLARVIAHREGLEFGRGLSNAQDACLWSHGLTGQIDTWIDVGLPGADRLHRASKCSENLLVFTSKSEVALRKEWRSRKIHRAEEIQVYRLPPEFVEALAQDLPRRVHWFVTIQDEQLSLAVDDRMLECKLEHSSLLSICSA